MLKEMCWLSPNGESANKILYLRINPLDGWKPYYCYPQFRVADHPHANGSLGYATMQALLKQGWRILPSSSVCLNHHVKEGNS